MAGVLLKMPARGLSACATAAAPADLAWNVLIDTSLWPRWGPSVRAVRCADRFIRAGSTGEVQLAFGPWLRFAVGRFEPGCFWDWRVAGVSATGHRVEPLGPDRCRIAFELSPLAAPYWPVCRVAATRAARLAEGESLVHLR
jgi:hypothetical protein